MIKGKVLGQRGEFPQPSIKYRESNRINQSLLKVYDSNPRQFYKQYVLGEKKDDESSYSLKLGDVVDFILLQCKGDFDEFDSRLDERFHIFEGVRGGGQLFDLADKLADITIRDTKDGEISSTFLERFTEALDHCKEVLGKFKGKTVEKVIDLFSNSDEEKYFSDLIKYKDKVLIDFNIVEKSKQIVKRVLEDINVSWIFSGNDMLEDLCHFVIEWEYTPMFGDVLYLKQEVDKILIDHENKIVHPFDLKAMWDSEGFSYSYLKYGYYIQAAFYYMGIQEWMKANGLKDYTLKDFKFVVVDTSSNNLKTLIYSVSEEDREHSLKGFSINGRPYTGLISLLDNVAWAISENIFDISKEAYFNNQLVNLKLNYDR